MPWICGGKSMASPFDRGLSSSTCRMSSSAAGDRGPTRYLNGFGWLRARARCMSSDTKSFHGASAMRLGPWVWHAPDQIRSKLGGGHDFCAMLVLRPADVERRQDHGRVHEERHLGELSA